MTDLFGNSVPMLALSLWEPWASLIVAGFKRHETRHWAAPARAIGQRVAIHASRTAEGLADAPADLCEYAFGRDWKRTRPFGCLVGVARLGACHRTSFLEPIVRHSDLLSGNYGIGRYGFQLDEVRALKDPLPLKGQQGFFYWRFPEDLESRLGPVIDHQAAADAWDRARAA